ncbi:MAG: TIGR00282 family metallophosphoesterase [Chloroflexi bacterium]|nr:TIGR00282 family metallophosphoesterase [Chloroflexota bacterium]
MKILMVGDVVGKPGRTALRRLLPELRREFSVDFVTVNGENAAAGFGLTEKIADEIFEAGANVITGGNHTFDQRDFIPSLDGEWPVLRPANYPEGTPGRGVARIGNIAVLNLQGRVFMPEGLDSPFKVADRLLAELEENPPLATVVDFHTEATSEQAALGWYLDGRVSAVVGTHTHVPTADAKMLLHGTAFVTDLGMTGPVNSVIGSRVEDVLGRFLTAMPRRLNVADEPGPAQFNSVLIEIDEHSGRATSIERVDRTIEV